MLKVCEFKCYNTKTHEHKTKHKTIIYSVRNNQGFDNIPAIKLLNENRLKQIGINKIGHILVILEAIKYL